MDEVNELWIGQIPAHRLAGFESMLASFGVQAFVIRTPNTSSFSLNSNSALDAHTRATLASKLARLGSPFELLHISPLGERYAFLPHLGLHRCDLNPVGEELISQGRLQSLIESSGGSNQELRRLIDVALGKPWIEALDLIRSGANRRVA